MVAFAGTIALATVVLIVVGPRAGSAGLAFEVAKAAIQVLGVAVVGGFVSAAIWALQRDRIERYERSERIRVERYEDLRRDADRRLEDRRRDDEFLLRVHDETISSYNEVKKIRRMSTGALRKVSDRVALPRDVYERSISEINDHQLAFEKMARQVSLMGDIDLYNRTDSRGRRENHFRVAEDYLNRVLQEYQRRHVGDGEKEGDIALDDVPRFGQFLRDVNRSQERFSNPIQLITKALEEQIRRPVDLPTIVEAA